MVNAHSDAISNSNTDDDGTAPGIPTRTQTSSTNTQKTNVDDGSRWRIWSVIEELETNGLSSSDTTTSQTDDDHHDVTHQVIQILQHWGETWAGQKGWHTLLNKKSLLHEVEESIIALQLFVDWLETTRHHHNGNDMPPPVTLVDVCCGKGILSMLASYLFRDKRSTHVSSIIMLDKQKDINWNHIVASNACAVEEGRPLIQTWGGCNLHEIDTIVEKLEEEHTQNNRQPLALVGIHLCKQLSPACAGVVNTLGPKKVPYFCLAPCCLPRVVRNLSKSNNNDNAMMIPLRNRRMKSEAEKGAFIVPVRTYESPEDRHVRVEANQRRDSAKKRTFADAPCFLCSEIHPIHKCNLLPSDENERLDIFQKASAMRPCFKCGEVGHFRKDCPSTQSASKPRLALPPTIELDVVAVLQPSPNGETAESEKGPFSLYCDLLATAIERENIKVLDVGLVNNSAQHNNAANADNWNRDRKSVFIVASSLS